MTAIDWTKLKTGLPATCHDLLERLRRACESGGDDPARRVEKQLREELAGFEARFKQLKGGRE